MGKSKKDVLLPDDENPASSIKRDLVEVIDNSGISLRLKSFPRTRNPQEAKLQNEELRKLLPTLSDKELMDQLEYSLNTGGAAAVALGHASAALRREWNVTYIAAPKTPVETELARRGFPFPLPYNDRIIPVHYVHLPEKEYKIARDSFFSMKLWFRFQKIINPEFLLPFLAEDWKAYKSINKREAQLVSDESIIPPNAIVVVHDSHLGPFGSFLKKYRSDIQLGFFAHTAFFDSLYLLELVANMRGRYGNDSEMNVLKGYLKSLSKGYDALLVQSRMAEIGLISALTTLGLKVPVTAIAPVTVDREVIKKRLNPDPEKDRQAYQELEQVNSNLDKIFGDRKVIIAGGRAEPYKNLPVVIDAYVKLCLDGQLDPSEHCLALLTSITRADVELYSVYWDKLQIHINTANKILEKQFGVKGIELLNGGNHVEVLATMARAVINVTPAHNEGYNLMVEESITANPDCIQVVSRTAGVSEVLAPVDGTRQVLDLTIKHIASKWSKEKGKYICKKVDVEATARVMADANDLTYKEIQQMKRAREEGLDRDKRSPARHLDTCVAATDEGFTNRIRSNSHPRPEGYRTNAAPSKKVRPTKGILKQAPRKDERVSR